MRNGIQPTETMNVLLIEGHPDVRTPMEYVLLSRGHRVTAADSGEKALKVLEGGGFDAVICNYHLPGMSGIDFFYKSRRILTRMTTILTAAYADDYMANNALALGVSVVMEMPFKMDNLMACIEGRIPDLSTGALGRHLYVTNGGQMMAISPTGNFEESTPPRPSRAPRLRAINLPGRRWKLYLNPDAPRRCSNGAGSKQSKDRNRSRLENGKNLLDLC